MCKYRLRSWSLIHTGIATTPFTTHQFRDLALYWRAATSIVSRSGQCAQTCRSPCRNFSVSVADSPQPAHWLHGVGFNSSVPKVLAKSGTSKHQTLTQPLAISVPVSNAGSSCVERRGLRDLCHTPTAIRGAAATGLVRNAPFSVGSATAG